MKKFITSSALAVLVLPGLLNASGLGLYVPVSLGIDYSGTRTITSITGSDFDVDYDGTLGTNLGLGIAYDTNLGADSLFNYRLGVEYTSIDYDKRYVPDGTNISLINTMGFGVFRNETIRVWIGPRLNVAYEWSDGDAGVLGTSSTSGVEVGIAPAAGINVNLGSAFTLAFDLDYKFAVQVGSTSYSNSISNTVDSVYYEGRSGPTARFSLFWRFGEEI